MKSIKKLPKWKTSNNPNLQNLKPCPTTTMWIRIRMVGIVWKIIVSPHHTYLQGQLFEKSHFNPTTHLFAQLFENTLFAPWPHARMTYIIWKLTNSSQSPTHLTTRIHVVSYEFAWWLYCLQMRFFESNFIKN